MDHSIELPGITHLTTHVADGEHCTGVAAYIHHQLPPEEMKRIARAVELLIPAMLKIAATL